MKWEKEYETGIPVIDAQHKQILSCFELLEDRMEKGINAADINDFLVMIKRYTTRHVILEEKYMKQSDYLGLDKQIKEHQYFISRFTEIEEEFNETGLTQQIVNTLRKDFLVWVKDHVTVLDKAFAQYYKKHGT